MVFVRKPIDIVSPADGQHYTSITQYEKSLHSKGQDIMTEKHYNQLRERCHDMANSKSAAPKEIHNHVHIDFANGRVTTSRKDYNDR